MNIKKPPFDNVKVRLRRQPTRSTGAALIQAVHQGGGGARRGAGCPSPTACGACPSRICRAARHTASRRGRRRRPRSCSAEAGLHAAAIRSGSRWSTRAIADLRRHGVVRGQRAEAGGHRGDARSRSRRRSGTRWRRAGEYQIGANLTGIGVDDPDANFFENFAAARRGTTAATATSRSTKHDRAAVAGARPEEAPGAGAARSRRSSRRTRRGRSSGWRLDYFTVWPHVKTWSRTTIHLQLRPHAGRLAGQVAPDR